MILRLSLDSERKSDQLVMSAVTDSWEQSSKGFTILGVTGPFLIVPGGLEFRPQRSGTKVHNIREAEH